MAKIDWKQLLPIEEQETLGEMLERIKKYEYAYLRADDVKVAQLWCALVELIKELKEIKKTTGKLSEPFKRIVEIGEAEKRKAIERIVSEIIKPATKEEEEATKRLVDSLMKF